jgi:hypothetical protein
MEAIFEQRKGLEGRVSPKGAVRVPRNWLYANSGEWSGAEPRKARFFCAGAQKNAPKFGIYVYNHA